MKQFAIIALLLLAGCGNNQAAEDALLLKQGREIIASTDKMVEIRTKLIAALTEVPESPDQQHELEVARLELDAAKLEQKRLRDWEANFQAAIEKQDSKKAEYCRREFLQMIERLRDF